MHVFVNFCKKKHRKNKPELIMKVIYMCEYKSINGKAYTPLCIRFKILFCWALAGVAQ